MSMSTVLRFRQVTALARWPNARPVHGSIVGAPSEAGRWQRSNHPSLQRGSGDLSQEKKQQENGIQRILATCRRLRVISVAAEGVVEMCIHDMNLVEGPMCFSFSRSSTTSYDLFD